MVAVSKKAFRLSQKDYEETDMSLVLGPFKSIENADFWHYKMSLEFIYLFIFISVFVFFLIFIKADLFNTVHIHIAWIRKSVYIFTNYSKGEYLKFDLTEDTVSFKTD